MSSEEDELEYYSGDLIASKNHKVPGWINFTIVAVLIWGVIWIAIFWNGNFNDWFDRGHWGQLQEAASTTYPYNSPY